MNTFVNLVAMTGKDSPKWSPITEQGYFDFAKEQGCQAVAITGITLYSLIPAWKLSQKTGVKLIVGATVFVCEKPSSETEACLPIHIYCMDDIGYKALCRIMTESQKNFTVRNNRTIPTVPFSILQKYIGEGSDGHEHLFGLSGGIDGVISGGLTTNIKEELLKSKNEYLDSLVRLRIFMTDVAHKLNVATEENKKLTNLSKKDLSYKEEFLKEQEKKLKSQTDPTEEDVTAYIKAVDEIELEKEAVKEAKAKIKTSNLQVKTLKKQWEQLQEQARELTSNMDCDNVETVSRLIKKVTAEVEEISEGDISPEDEMSSRMDRYKKLFGEDCFFLEVQNHGEDGTLMKHLCEMALAKDIDLVATNNVYRLNKEDRDLVSTVVYKETKEWEVTPEEEYWKDDKTLFLTLSKAVGAEYAKMAMDNRFLIADNCDVRFDHPDRHFPSYDCEEMDDKIEKEIANLVEIA